MTFYKVDKWRAGITPVEVVSETECFITLKSDGYYKTDRRAAKGVEYFPTFAAARSWLMNYYDARQKAALEEAERNHQLWLKLFNQEEPDAKA